MITALQLLHRLPDDLMYEIARHPFEHPESIASLPLPAATVESVLTEIRRQQQPLQAPASVKEQLSGTAHRVVSLRSYTRDAWTARLTMRLMLFLEQ